MARHLTQEEIADLQTKRKELVLRGVVVLGILIVAVICMILLEMNNVSWNDSNRFRIISLTLIAGLYGGYVIPLQKYPRFLQDYPEIVRERPWNYSIPTKWHLLRAVIFIGSLIVLFFAFISSNKPQPEAFNPSSVNKIQQPTIPVVPSEVEEIIDNVEDGSQ